VSVPAILRDLAGSWSGTNRLWLSPTEPARSSASRALVVAAGRDRFVRIDYTWAYEGAPQEGVLLLGVMGTEADVVWIDSFHNGDRIMHCSGSVDAAGTLTVLGHYPAPPGPDWGWRTRVEPRDSGAWRLVMHNVTPEGEEQLAVEAEYTRTG